MKSLVKVSNLSFSYDKEPTLSNVSFEILEGQKIALIGKNGGGKSTLVNIILGYGKKYKYQGDIEYNISKNDITYLPQIAEFYKNFPISIYEIVISGLINKKNMYKMFSKQEKEKAYEILKKFGIYDVKDSHVKDVSGGQLQRALLARTLISDRKLIFLDEPETYLDYNFFVEVLKDLSKKNKTIVIVTHELGKIREYIDKIYVVETFLKESLEGDHH